MTRGMVAMVLGAILTAGELRGLVHEADRLARVAHPSTVQRARAAAINARFERDMRARDVRAELRRENGR